MVDTNTEGGLQAEGVLSCPSWPKGLLKQQADFVVKEAINAGVSAFMTIRMHVDT